MVNALIPVLILVIGLVFAAPAHAYLDPGTGSMILQGIIGGIAAGLVVLRVYYHKIKCFFARLFGKKDEAQNAVSDD